MLWNYKYEYETLQKREWKRSLEKAKKKKRKKKKLKRKERGKERKGYERKAKGMKGTIEKER